jgi:hypothetical protein
VRLTGAESFWYILMCIAFGYGYFAKIPAVKALSELHQFRAEPHDQLVSQPGPGHSRAGCAAQPGR